MDSKIFLGKYRAPAAEMEAVGEIADSSVAYEAEEIDSGKKVVVEVVPAGSLKAAARERLETDAMAARKLSHANIPVLCDFGVEDNHLVYVTEDFEGTPAEEWVNANGLMPVGPVLRIASQVLSALGAAAIHQINHHAINPSNLLLVPGQTAEGDWPLVKVLHFVGVAPKTSGTDVAVAAFDKSLHYASPEQIQKGTVDFRSELFSLGATMWFLLTGAPPLVASAEPTAHPARFGVGSEKIAALPKKIRRLLSQMLAANPEERPGDLLAFDRTLQDCLHQVERRETMALRFGIPSFSTGGISPHRRGPVKALALAALFLAIATVGAVLVSGYLRHGRIVRAEEPIGKPIGVPEASASVTPADASAENAIVADVSPPTVASTDPNTSQSVPIKDAEADRVKPLPTAPESVESSTKEVAVAPVPPATPDSPVNSQTQEPAAVAANTPAPRSATSESSEIATLARVEAAPAQSPNAEANAVAQQTAPKETVMHEVRRAEPADDEPEARHTEPSSPAVGPESAAAKTTAATSEHKVPEESSTKKNEQAAQAKRQAEKRKYQQERISESERTRPRFPTRSRRARLVGVTPEGWWMLQSPSGRIIVVPPPPPSP
jgi:eukaryotic-like serine/threonine-protein kinase